MNATVVNYLGSTWTEEGVLVVDAKVETLDAQLVKTIAKSVRDARVYGIASHLADVRPAILEHIAEDPQTDTVTLAALATSSYENVREAVADNKNTPVSTLLVLAHDTSADVRFQIAENHNAPAIVLKLLAEDENPYIRWRAETTLHRLH